MDKRYQVFVSSTYEDLKDERREVIQALLELDCFPAGMELFQAADEDQWTVIKSVIDDCDYYVVIIGGRYGSTDLEGVSFTEKEYRYALEQGKPVMAFIQSPGVILVDKTDKDAELAKRLEDFRALVKQKMCRFWSTPSELGASVSRSVTQMVKTHPAGGWVPAKFLPTSDQAAEMLRLRGQIDELNSQLQEARTTAPEGTSQFAQGLEVFDMNYTVDIGTVYGRKEWTHQVGANWDTIFARLAPHMLGWTRESNLKYPLESLINDIHGGYLRRTHTGVDIGNVDLDETDFKTILVQLRALGYIKESERNETGKSPYVAWKLTEYGDSVMTKVRAIKKGASGIVRESKEEFGNDARESSD